MVGRFDMRAILQSEYGPQPEDVLRLGRLDVPAIEDDEVLVRVHAASVDRGTWHVMAGLPYPIRLAGFGFRRPKSSNPGRSLAGVVDVVGPATAGCAVGDEVFGICAGSFAECARVTTAKLALKPGLSITVVEAGRSISDVQNRGKYRQRALDYNEHPWPDDFLEDQQAKGIISLTMAVGGLALHWGGGHDSGRLCARAALRHGGPSLALADGLIAVGAEAEPFATPHQGDPALR